MNLMRSLFFRDSANHWFAKWPSWSIKNRARSWNTRKRKMMCWCRRLASVTRMVFGEVWAVFALGVCVEVQISRAVVISEGVATMTSNDWDATVGDSKVETEDIMTGLKTTWNAWSILLKSTTPQLSLLTTTRASASISKAGVSTKSACMHIWPTCWVWDQWMVDSLQPSAPYFCNLKICIYISFIFLPFFTQTSFSINRSLSVTHCCLVWWQSKVILETWWASSIIRCIIHMCQKLTSEVFALRVEWIATAFQPQFNQGVLVKEFENMFITDNNALPPPNASRGRGFLWYLYCVLRL